MKNEHSFASKINIDQFAKRKPPERIESDGYMFDVAFSSLLRWPLKEKHTQQCHRESSPKRHQ